MEAHPLSERLEKAGIQSAVSPSFPLVCDNIQKVFQAADRLTGLDCFGQFLTQEILPMYAPYMMAQGQPFVLKGPQDDGLLPEECYGEYLSGLWSNHPDESDSSGADNYYKLLRGLLLTPVLALADFRDSQIDEREAAVIAETWARYQDQLQERERKDDYGTVY